jgi:uncharacterized protein HemX
MWAIGVALSIGAIGWMFVRWQQSEAAARVSRPPASAEQSKAIVAHLAAKYEAARAAPRTSLEFLRC